MNLLGETKLPRAKAPQRYFVKPVQSPQGGLPISSNVEFRHSENKSMQNVFQCIEGGKTFDRRASASSHKWEAYRRRRFGRFSRRERRSYLDPYVRSQSGSYRTENTPERHRPSGSGLKAVDRVTA